MLSFRNTLTYCVPIYFECEKQTSSLRLFNKQRVNKYETANLKTIHFSDPPYAMQC
jgi:hypothetical protein